MPDQPSTPEMGNGPEERFAQLVDAFRGQPGVTPPDTSSRRFGSSALKVNGSIFAMLTRGHLIVKLPRERVGELIRDGTGSPFAAGKGTPMKEWLTVETDDGDIWSALAHEALDFVVHQMPK